MKKAIEEETKVGNEKGVELRKKKKKFEEDYFSQIDFSEMEVSVENMFKSGVYFGHHKSRKNPQMNEYIFATKNDINILDLQKTASKMKEAMKFIEDIISSGQDILFVGTKKQAKKIIQSAAKRCEMPYVCERWLGGTFTNFEIISSRIRYLRDGLEKKERGEYSKYTKFEEMKKGEELDRMEFRMGGIKNLKKLPGAIFVVSIQEDNLAIKEAIKKNIPIVALADTNVDIRGIDYPIPANEDATSSLKLMIGYVVKAVLDGKNLIGKNLPKTQK